MKNTNKKGFTIVELVIVIAVIGILAAVLIPTFSNLVKRANESKDTQLVKNLNTALAADVNGDKTIVGALAAAAEFGYDVAKINASATDNEILWDSVNNVFCYLKDSAIEYIPEFPGAKEVDDDADYWVIDDEVNTTYSTYYYGGDINSETTTNICVATNGEDLTINAPNATVLHYGEAGDVIIEAVHASASYHEFGSVASLKVTKGHIVPEAGSKIQVLAVVGSEVTVKVESSSAEILVVVIDSNNASSIADAIKEAVKDVVDADAIKEATSDKIDEVISTNKAFADGNGTKENPYIIMTAEQLKNIGNNYDSYAYYKVADGVSVIDCSGWPQTIYLNGSFDGNGVTLANLSYSLFRVVGYNNNEDDIVIKNFTANMNSSSALVRNIYNSGKTTFENITLYGTIEGSYNMGSFYNYGTANLGGSNGADYTVEFKNAKSYLTLICTTGNTIGGMFGHGYEGDDYKLSVNMDDDSGYHGKMYTNAGTCYAIMGMCSHSTYILNGVETSRYTNTYIANKLNTVDPVETNNGYTIEKQEGASYYTVSVNAQVTSYDAEGNKISNESGITMVLDSQKIENPGEKVFEKFDSFEIVNETINGEYGYAIENGVLKAYVGNRNALSGTITLYVTQYDANGNILSIGSVVLGNIAEK